MWISLSLSKYCESFENITKGNVKLQALYIGSRRGDLSLESRVKFPYIHESRKFLEPSLVTVNV